jgi:hypothetical protein
MRIKSIKGEFTIIDNNKTITTTDSAQVWGYVLTMMSIRPIPCVTPSIYPVRALVPHPKKRRPSKRMRELVKKIKSQYINYTI